MINSLIPNLLHGYQWGGQPQKSNKHFQDEFQRQYDIQGQTCFILGNISAVSLTSNKCTAFILLCVKL